MAEAFDSAPVRAGSTNFQDVDWTRTRAFGLGLNGLYINRKGREKYGCVEAAEADELEQELIRKLTEIRDPENDEQVITGGHDGSIRFWNAASGQQERILEHDHWITALALSSLPAAAMLALLSTTHVRFFHHLNSPGSA